MSNSNEKLKILLITARYFPHRGGLESVVHHLAHEFIQNGHIVQIITNHFPRTLPGEEIIEGVQVKRLFFLYPDLKYIYNSRVDLWLAGLWYKFNTTWVLQRLIKKFNPDVINNHYLNEVAEFTGNSILGLPSAIPWIISFHGGDVDGEPFLNEVNRQRFIRFSKQADRITACSDFLARQAQMFLPGSINKIEVIHNGVDNSRFSHAIPTPSEYPYILAVGQLVHHKGFDLLIQSFSIVAKKYPFVQLWIAGSGSQREELEKIIRSKFLESQIKLIGKVDEKKVASLMAGCLFLAVPSRREPFGLVALEGMASGKTVLASFVGGLPEFLPVPPNRLIQFNVEEWGAALDEWLEKTLHGSIDGRENIKEANRRDWSCVAQNYLKLYESVISNE